LICSKVSDRRKWRNFFRESLKDRRGITHRKAKKAGEKDNKRGISNLKIAVVVAQDRNGNKAGTGRVKAEEIDALSIW